MAENEQGEKTIQLHCRIPKTTCELIRKHAGGRHSIGRLINEAVLLYLRPGTYKASIADTLEALRLGLVNKLMDPDDTASHIADMLELSGLTKDPAKTRAVVAAVLKRELKEV